MGQVEALGALCGVIGHEVWPLTYERLSGVSGLRLDLVTGEVCDSPEVLGSL